MVYFGVRFGANELEIEVKSKSGADGNFAFISLRCFVLPRL